MNILQQDYETLANHKLIKQVALYYNSSKQNIEDYRDMDCQTLEQMATEHLMHWKNELHNLIFNGMNCSERCELWMHH